MTHHNYLKSDLICQLACEDGTHQAGKIFRVVSADEYQDGEDTSVYAESWVHVADMAAKVITRRFASDLCALPYTTYADEDFSLAQGDVVVFFDPDGGLSDQVARVTEIFDDCGANSFEDTILLMENLATGDIMEACLGEVIKLTDPSEQIISANSESVHA